MNWSREASLAVPTPWGDVGYDLLRRPDGESDGSAWADPRDAVVVVAVREERANDAEGRADDAESRSDGESSEASRDDTGDATGGGATDGDATGGGATDGDATGGGDATDTADREVVLIEEYRPKLRETVVTCPVGRLEDGESFEAGAARELREEAGFDPGTTELLDVHYPVSWLRKRRGVVFATDLTPVETDRDDGEFTDPRTVPADEAISRARTTGPTTGWTLAPLLLADHEGLL